MGSCKCHFGLPYPKDTINFLSSLIPAVWWHGHTCVLETEWMNESYRMLGTEIIEPAIGYKRHLHIYSFFGRDQRSHKKPRHTRRTKSITNMQYHLSFCNWFSVSDKKWPIVASVLLRHKTALNFHNRHTCSNCCKHFLWFWNLSGDYFWRRPEQYEAHMHVHRIATAAIISSKWNKPQAI